MKYDDVFDDGEDIEEVKSALNNQWAISYSDLVTVLLCFFILMYAIEKELDKSSLQTIKVNLTSGFEKDIGEQTQSKYSKNNVRGLTGIAGISEPLKVLSLEEGVVIEKNVDYFNIIFDGQTFFNSGSYQMNPDGQRLVDVIIKAIKPVNSLVKLDIRGYADPIPVKRTNKRWWKNNMELSVLRSLNVYNYMVKTGIDTKSLNVTGVGTNNLIKDRKDDLAKNRRISFRIEMREKDIE